MSRKLEIAVANGITVIGKFPMRHRWPKTEADLVQLIDEWNDEMLRSSIAIGTAKIKLADLTEYNAKVAEIANNYRKWVSDTGGIEVIAIGEILLFERKIARMVALPLYKGNADKFKLTDLPFPYESSPLNTDIVVDCLIGSIIAKARDIKVQAYFPRPALAIAVAPDLRVAGAEDASGSKYPPPEDTSGSKRSRTES